MSDHDAIAKRAYELYLERGSVPGYEVEDWLAAEAELTAATVSAAAASDAPDEALIDGKRAGGKRGSNRRDSTPPTRRSIRP